MPGSGLEEVLPKFGVLHLEDERHPIVCKPKVLSLKSITLEKLEKLQKDAQETLNNQERLMQDYRAAMFKAGYTDPADLSTFIG